MKVALGSVVYQEASKFKSDFIESINNQNTSDFDVILLNDNLKSDGLAELVEEISQTVYIVESKIGSSIPELRISLIEVAKEMNYDLLILIDFDDTMSSDRIKSNISEFDDQYTFFYNELYYLDSKEKFFKSMPSKVDSILPVLESNFLGLSNTALNLKRVDNDFMNVIKTLQTVAFDWILYSSLLLRGSKGKKVDTCGTFYRIHSQNTAGDTNTDLKSLKKELDIKLEHYLKLLTLDESFDEIYKGYLELSDLFKKEPSKLLNKAYNNNRYWWGSISLKYFEGEKNEI